MSIDLERVFPVEQREAAKFLQEHIFPELPENHFFLVGGTALALRFGHRQSIDLDFFSFPFKSTYDAEVSNSNYGNSANISLISIDYSFMEKP